MLVIERDIMEQTISRALEQINSILFEDFKNVEPTSWP